MSNFDKLINRNKNEVLKPLASQTDSYSESKILSYLQTHKKKILLVGEVQSGKTRKIIDLINMSLNMSKFKFDIIIVFGGTTIDLNNQTERRFKSPCQSAENFNNHNCGFGDDIRVKFKDFASIYTSEDASKTVIYIGPKLDKSLENISGTVEDIPNKKDKKILVIDDESDYGSLNTKELYDPSKFASIIDKLYNVMSNNGSALISITATPYANLLNKKAYPYDYIFALPCKKNEGYTGVTYFNNLNDFYINIDNSKLWEKLGGFRTPEGKQLYFSFCVYILNTIIKSTIKKENFINHKSDWLINTDYSMSTHSKISRTVSSIISEVHNSLPSFVKTLNVIAEELNKSLQISENDVSDILNKIRIIILNSNKNTQIASSYNIYIGGVKLSRGMTYEHLTLEYITNFPKKNISADTLLQMCRWFGYREHLQEFPYMNVITTNKGIIAIKEIEKYNDLFYDYKKNVDTGGEKTISKILNELAELEKSCVYVKGCNLTKR